MAPRTSAPVILCDTIISRTYAHNVEKHLNHFCASREFACRLLCKNKDEKSDICAEWMTDGKYMGLI